MKKSYKSATALVLTAGMMCSLGVTASAATSAEYTKNENVLVKGNHDKIYDMNLFDEVCDFKTISLNGIYLALMHYPMCFSVRVDFVKLYVAR